MTHLVEQRKRSRLPADILIEARILERDGQVSRQQFQGPPPRFGEETRNPAAHVENSNSALLDCQWDSSFRDHTPSCIDISRVLPNVLNDDTLAAPGRLPHQSLPHPELPVTYYLFREAFAVLVGRLAASIVQKQDCKGVELEPCKTRAAT